ncbi:hypothetical protein [Nocardia salmonicida]|uniref:hypothetical protein n=1 Tax=Nocardia salmonicida TaxID=53431 RepID=UPI0033D5583D
MNGVLAAPGTRDGGIHTQLTDMACVAVPGVKEACQLGSTAKAAAGAASESWLEKIATQLMESLGSALRTAMAWWTTFPSPQLATADGRPAPVLAQIREYTSGLQVVLLTAGIMFAAARLALAKRGGAAGEAQESFMMLARAIFAAATFGTLITVATTAGDEFADWVIFDATRGDLDRAVTRLATVDPATNSVLGWGLLLILALLGLICTLVQLVMLVVRQALLVVVVAVIPMAAAASGTGPGSQAYKRLIAWSLAFVLWKPVGALVYAIAFTVAGTEEQNDPYMVLLGILLMLMSVVVLPALIRLIAPAVATLGGGGGAGAALAGAGVGIAMSAAGSRPQARKMSEGEGSASQAGGGGGGSSPPPPGGGNGARSMTASPSGSGTPAPAQTGGTASSAAGSGAATGGGGAAGASASGAASVGGAAAAGPAGAAIVAAQAGVAALRAVASSAAQAPEESSATDPDVLRPGEVRR